MTDNKDPIAQLLDQAPVVPASPDLRQQIMTAALLDLATPVPPSTGLRDTILANAIADTPKTADIMTLPGKPANHWTASNALVGGLMAASLIIGIWGGSSGVVDNLLDAPFELAGLPTSQTNDNFNLYNVLDDLTPQENLQ